MAGTDPNTPSRGKVCPRKPWLALVLSACPGLGQHYAGFMKRGIVMYVTLILASWLAAIIFMMMKSKLSVGFLAVPFVGVGLIALDAYLCARRQPRNYHLQWFNRPWIYGGVFVALLATVNPVMDFFVGNNIVRAFFMGSSSMQPALTVVREGEALPGHTRNGALSALFSLRETRTNSAACAVNTSL